MIQQLYEPFRKWSERGSIYIISDTHFEDSDCKFMNPDWITPQEHIDIINSKVGKGDTIICLGDCGNLEWFKKIKAGYKVLIKGNHDDKGNSVYEKYFDEVYAGPLMIAPKILLSHEPVVAIPFCINLHGHVHNGDHIWTDIFGGEHINLASDVINWSMWNLGAAIKKGLVSNIEDIHRITINNAIDKNKNL